MGHHDHLESIAHQGNQKKMREHRGNLRRFWLPIHFHHPYIYIYIYTQLYTYIHGYESKPGDLDDTLESLLNIPPNVVIMCKNRFWPIPYIYICSYWCGCHQAEWIVERQTGKSWLIKVNVSPVNMHRSRNEYCPTPKNMGVSWNKGTLW